MPAPRQDQLLRLLRRQAALGSAELCAALGGVNRSTLARELAALAPRIVTRGGSRRIRHALRRPLRGNEAPLPLYRVDEQGRVVELGLLDLVQPAGSALSDPAAFPWPLAEAMRDGWFDGLPYPLVDMRPQGFLGRSFAREHALALGVSANADEWSDDDVAWVLANQGHDLPGDLILGETSCRRFLALRDAGGEGFLDDGQLPEAYPRLAEAALAHGPAGSSAAGEFPKFTAGRLVGGEPCHVIVKFSGADASPAVRRWGDLLVCEHLANQTLAGELGIPAAESTIMRFAGRTFLEVRRFDRHGAVGRSPVGTLESINAALLGRGPAPWPASAAALLAAGWLSAEARHRIALIWWFGRLIANSDMHEGNLAFRPGLVPAPVYDMLPMAYAPLRGGELPLRQFAPECPLPSEAAPWQWAAAAAERFWGKAAEDGRITDDFRCICAENAGKVRSLIGDPWSVP